MDAAFVSGPLGGAKSRVCVSRAVVSARVRSTTCMSAGRPSGRGSFNLGGFGAGRRSKDRRDGDGGGFGGGVGDGSNGGGVGRGAGGGAGGAGSSSQGPLGSLWASYNSLLASRPLLTKALTSFVGFSLGDILAQKFLNEQSEIFWDRVLRMGLVGFAFHGPTGHYFYGWLDGVLPGTQTSTVALKVVIDQLIWAPIFTVGFFTVLGLLDRKSFGDIRRKIESDLMPGVTTSWKVWPLAHAINFRFIPPAQRLLYINSIQVGYNVFLSFLGNKEPVDDIRSKSKEKLPVPRK